MRNALEIRNRMPMLPAEAIADAAPAIASEKSNKFQGAEKYCRKPRPAIFRNASTPNATVKTALAIVSTRRKIKSSLACLIDINAMLAMMANVMKRSNHGERMTAKHHVWKGCSQGHRDTGGATWMAGVSVTATRMFLIHTRCCGVKRAAPCKSKEEERRHGVCSGIQWHS